MLNVNGTASMRSVTCATARTGSRLNASMAEKNRRKNMGGLAAEVTTVP
ncbi:MAG: hypothetical protein IPP94_07805 [Ignavibacteria bacterium]|nr:hypothetical protein [Ignavibacteria bacterium]